MNSEQTKTGNAQPNNTASQPVNPKPDEKLIADNAAETIAGDNKFLAAILKILLSPLTLIAGAALVMYWMNGSKKEKQEYDRLKMEHDNLKEEYTELKKKYKKLKVMLEPDKSIHAHEQPKLPNLTLNYRTSYLD